MATRMLLICHGSTTATRSSAFPLDEPLEAGSAAAATALADRLATDGPARSGPAAAFSGPAVRCRQTADALGLRAAVDSGLADWDLAGWAGRSLDDLATTNPDDVGAWTTDPTFSGHGGETLAEVIQRVGRWLDEPAAERPSRFLAVTHPAWIRAAVVHALQAPAQSFWRIDVAPLTVTELRGAPGRWSLYPRLIG